MEALPSDAPCPECGGRQRVRLELLPLVDVHAAERVLWLQAAGVIPIVLGGGFAPGRFFEIGAVLWILGGLLCVVVGPLLAMTNLYASSRIGRQPRAVRQPGAAPLFVVVAGLVALASGVLIGISASILTVTVWY